MATTHASLPQPGKLRRVGSWLYWHLNPALRWKAAQWRREPEILRTLSRYYPAGEKFQVVDLPTWHKSLAPALVRNSDGEGLFRTDLSVLGDLDCEGLIEWDVLAETFTLTAAGREGC